MNQDLLKEILLENNGKFQKVEYFPRELTVSPVHKKPIVITGARRSGKSTYMTQILRDYDQKSEPIGFASFNFVDERIRPLQTKILGDIENAFYELYPEQEKRRTLWFLDEVQLVPDWEYFVERLARDKKNLVFVTGSSANLLSKEIASSLRGRPLSFELFPFSFCEYVKLNKGMLKPKSAAERRRVQSLFITYLEDGGFPETLGMDKAVQNQILSEYYRTMLTRDLIERHNPKNSLILEHCIKSFFNLAGRTLSFNKLSNNLRAQGIALSVTQIGEYLKWVEDTYYLFSVELFSDSLQKRRVNPRKIYAIDNGLLLATTSQIRKNRGLLLENLVFVFLRSLGHTIFYGKTTTGREVDFVVKNARTSTTEMIQICYDVSDESTMTREVGALVELLTEYKIPFGTVVTLDFEDRQTVGGKKIQFIPAWKFLLAAD